MKANEAPEKLYLLPNGQIVRCRNKEDDVEYTRTDAFIEKACEYFRAKKKCVFACIGEDVYKSLLNKEEIEDFKNYMKGE
jgi:hypothetical protein